MLPVDIRSIAVGPLQTNCYLLWDHATKCAAIVDPGGDESRITSEADSLGLSVEWILLTHGHFDHAYCAAPLAEKYDARIGMHQFDVPLLMDGLDIAETLYDLSQYAEVKPSDLLLDGQSLRLGQSDIRVVCTPGHSRGGLCLATDAGVICGDTIFAGSIGRTDFTGGSYKQLIESIRTRILTLPDDTRLYPGHGPVTTVGNERQSNPYLR